MSPGYPVGPPPGWDVTRRTTAPDERPREYNDPSNRHELDSFYDRPSWPDRIKIGIMLTVLLAILAGVGFVVFNLISGYRLTALHATSSLAT